MIVNDFLKRISEDAAKYSGYLILLDTQHKYVLTFRSFILILNQPILSASSIDKISRYELLFHSKIVVE